MNQAAPWQPTAKRREAVKALHDCKGEGSARVMRHLRSDISPGGPPQERLNMPRRDALPRQEGYDPVEQRRRNSGRNGGHLGKAAADVIAEFAEPQA